MSTPVDDQELWDEFHRVVNMTSRELSDWLMTAAASEDSEQLPDQAGDQIGQQVLRILGKRRGDLTPDDLRVMGKVVERVHQQRRDDLEPTMGQDAWRHRLMTIGHDPLKPA